MKNKRAEEILGAASLGRTCAALAAMMLAGLLVAGCGQKGPLMLPAAASKQPTQPVPVSTRDNATRDETTPTAPR